MKATMLRTQGFTLVEVLMALSLFAMLAGVMYAALGSAGNGFQQLISIRDDVAAGQWLDRQLRSDLMYASRSEDDSVTPLVLTQDVRGGQVLDQLTLLVREPGRAGLSQVHYAIDEVSGELVRESRLALARDSVAPDRWPLAKADSFDVEVLDAQGRWQQRWEPGKPFVLPKAVRVHVWQRGRETVCLMPLLSE